MVMSAVRIAQLKSRLSQHLREVRAGKTFTVLDRSTPVARIMPIETDDDLVVTRPAAGTPPFHKLRIPPAPKLQVDVVDLLLDDRRRR